MGQPEREHMQFVTLENGWKWVEMVGDPPPTPTYPLGLPPLGYCDAVLTSSYYPLTVV